MADTIREQIIAAIVEKLAEIRIDYGYVTNAGKSVYRAAAEIPSASLPAINVFPRIEESIRQYGKQVNVMPVDVQAFALVGTTNPSETGEQLLGDLIVCLNGPEKTLAFTSGGTYSIEPGDIIRGATSGASAITVEITITSGSWAAGTAAGTIRARTQSGTFVAENLDIGTHLNVATIAANSTAIQAKDITGAGLIEDIAYTGGGVSDYPQMTDAAVVVTASVTVQYSTDIGDPFTQT